MRQVQTYNVLTDPVCTSLRTQKVYQSSKASVDCENQLFWWNISRAKQISIGPSKTSKLKHMYANVR